MTHVTSPRFTVMNALTQPANMHIKRKLFYGVTDRSLAAVTMTSSLLTPVPSPCFNFMNALTQPADMLIKRKLFHRVTDRSLEVIRVTLSLVTHAACRHAYQTKGTLSRLITSIVSSEAITSAPCGVTTLQCHECAHATSDMHIKQKVF